MIHRLLECVSIIGALRIGALILAWLKIEHVYVSEKPIARREQTKDA
jgi:hypothetical protein